MAPSNDLVPTPPQKSPKGPLEPSKILAGKRLVIVGGTGFLGKVWLSMLLFHFPELGHLYLLVRPKEGQSAEERFWAQIAPSAVFDPLRERYGSEYEAFLREKITPVAGDVVLPELGIDASFVSAEGPITAVVNVAGVVDFNPPLDEALDVNAFGVNNLVDLAKRLGAPVMHTSTCYVAGYREGLIEEVDPREIPFPRALGEAWHGGGNARSRLELSHWDPQREIAECMDLVKQARQRSGDAFRQSAFLDQAKENLRSRGEPCRGKALEDELSKVKRKFVEEQLIAAGRERALFWGWTNIYTYTKSIGEQVLASSGVPFTIVRPAVIESADTYPFAGWNEGINTSAPIIYMALKGQVQFPADPRLCLDIIPVDMVAAGMIASLVELCEGTAPTVYQYGSTDTNACKMVRYIELIGLYKRKLVFDGKRTKLFDYVSQHFEPRGLTKKQYQQHGAHALASVMRGAGTVLEKLSVGPIKELFLPAAKALESAARTEDKQGDVIDLFLPFIAEGDWVFSCANTRAAMERMPPEERARFYWQPEKIDWRQWMFEIHLPGLEKWVIPEIDERLRRETKPLRRYDTLLDLVDEMAERHDLAVALQEMTDEGLTRTSFRDVRAASIRVASRLMGLGVKRGDRVLLAGHNRPGWPLAYFGILRAGGVAVPFDPGLEGPQLANIIRSSGARLAIWGSEVDDKGGAAARSLCPDLWVLDLAEVTALPDNPSEAAFTPEQEAAAEGVRPGHRDIASVIYTSGTTGEPKGVMLSHENFTSLLASLAALFPLTENDRVLSVLPLHHTFEFACGLLLPLSRGSRILYLGEVSPERLTDGLAKGRITAMVGVPALWQLLERRILARVAEGGPMAEKAFDLGLELNRLIGRKVGLDLGRVFFGVVHKGLGGHVRHLISGGAALPKGTAEVFSGLGLHLSEGYGLTEASPVLTVAKATPGTKAGHVGKPIPGVEIKIANADDQGVGEILAKGPNVMVGYANNEEATRAAIDADGWLHTGDLGKLDKKGKLVIVGRQKDVIVSASGENVYPDDLESLLGKVAFVKELAIVGIDDPRGGERVACLAVPERDDEETAPESSGGPPSLFDIDSTRFRKKERHDRALKALREAFQRLPKGMVPAVLHVVDADLPRTATRKVKRPEVRDILQRIVVATAPAVAGDAGSEVSRVRHAIAALAGRKATELAGATQLKAELGFDSLLTMELGAALEPISGVLDTTALARCETVGDVESLVRTTGSRGASEAARTVEKVQEEVEIPAPIASALKSLLGKAQMGFYGDVMDPKVYGRAFIPHNRSALVAANHSSHLDMGFVKYALGDYGEGLVSLAAQDYFFEGNPLRRAYFKQLTNLAAFDRKGGLRQALRQAGEILEEGKTLLIFPEGTRSVDGRIQEFKPAIGHLALTHGVDILPVFLRGTHESWAKGKKLPTKRRLEAHIGPPLCIEDLRRLTAGMKITAASRRIAELTQEAVCALRDGKVLDLSRVETITPERVVEEHRLVSLFRELEAKFDPSRVSQPVTYYFTLGNDADAKWTLRIGPDGCEAKLGKPTTTQADCVLKTSEEIFLKICREAYTPSPMEFMTGAVKSNDISLLQTFQKAFHLG
jgi:long-chain acyl-CoA synthetase